MKLSLRLAKIAELVKTGSKLADIGTDHAALPIHLIRSGVVDRCIATENRPGPFRIAVSAVRRAGLADRISVRLGNGLKPLLPGEVDTVVLAGMGGLTIIEILKQSPGIASSIGTFIFQPMVAQPDLRRYLLHNGYRIITERLVLEDDKFYEIIVSEHGFEPKPDDIYYETGIQLVRQRDPLFLKFIDHKIEKTRNIIENLKKSSFSLDKLKEMETRLHKYMEVKQCWRNAPQ